MENANYWDEYPSAITICNSEGIIVYMNRKSVLTFDKYGGSKLIGQSLYSCHNPNSVGIIKNLLKTGESNTYTIEKAGVKKLIHQSPWYCDGKVAGLIEMSIELPENMPHHIRG